MTDPDTLTLAAWGLFGSCGLVAAAYLALGAWDRRRRYQQALRGAQRFEEVRDRSHFRVMQYGVNTPYDWQRESDLSEYSL